MLSQVSYASRPAISYIRFSTKEQKDGSSIYRQTEAAREFAQHHGMELKDTIADEGISAFKSKNLEQGALSELIEAYRDGHISRDTVLIVDDVSRFSRAGVRVVQRNLDHLMTLGVTVAFIDENLFIDERTFDARIDIIIRVVLAASGANEFSKQLSRKVELSYKARKDKLGSGEEIKLTHAPAWLDKKTRKLKEPEATTVRRIVELLSNGTSQLLTARALNEEGYPVFGKGKEWRQSNIASIVSNPALCGAIEYPRGSGDLYRNQFESLITEDDWNALRTIGRKRQGRRNATTSTNVLSGMVKCACCGSAMVAVSSKNKYGMRYSYFGCFAKKTNGKDSCPNGYIREDVLVDHLLDRYGFMAGQKRTVTGGFDQETQEIERVSGEIKTLQEQQRVALDDALRQDETIRNVLYQRTREMEQEIEQKKAELQTLKAKPASARTITDQDLEEAFTEGHKLKTDDPVLLNAKLMRVIDRIEVTSGTEAVLIDEEMERQFKALVTTTFRDGSQFNSEIPK